MELRPVTVTPAHVRAPTAQALLASRATMALAVLVEVAVVAELDTFRGVEMVANLVSAMAAEELMSASTMDDVDNKPLISVWTIPVELRLAKVRVPAVKLPKASRATMAEAVLDEVAVVAEFDTFRGVEMVASLASVMVASVISLLTIKEVEVTPEGSVWRTPSEVKLEMVRALVTKVPVMVSPVFKTFNDAAPVRDPVRLVK